MENNLFHIYNRFPVTFSYGKGMYLYDTEGKEYLDFASGIGVMAFGYSDEEFTAAINNQVDKLLHTSNLFYHTTLINAAESVCRVSGMDQAFFTNSGAEAVEGALKCAKKYAYNKNPNKSYEVIAFNKSFHGRTIGALSVTGNTHYREPFNPLMDGVSFADVNDFESVLSLVNDNTCAIIIEPVQGEGGIIPASKEFLKSLRDLCDQKDIILIFDEIQCGMGRTGSAFVWQKYDIRPDILLSAKALGGGIPVGAMLLSDKVANASLVPGDHGTTYGGNPLACAAVDTSVRLMEKRDIFKHVNDKTKTFEKILDDFVEKYDFILERRGLGFMQGLVLREDKKVSDIVGASIKNGLIVLSAEGNVLRMLPPLICDDKDFIKMQEMLDKILATS